MLSVRIPYCERELVGDGVKSVKHEIRAKIDTTVFAEERWERTFPENAKNETLFAYIGRIVEKGEDAVIKDKATVASMLKAIYCFIESDEISSFKAFAQLFDLSDEQTLTEQVDVINRAFKAILQDSTATAKN